MRISGWQRLWVVVSALYLAVVVAVAFFTFPDEKDIPFIRHSEEFWDRFPTALKKNLLIWENTKPVTDPEKLNELNNKSLKASEKEELIELKSVTMPNYYEIRYFPEATKEEIKKVSDRYVEILKEELFYKKINFLFKMFLVWILPCVTVYVIGWSLGWVYRGFKFKAP